MIKQAVPFKEAILADGSLLKNQPDLKGKYNSGDDLNMCDWVTLVHWESSVDKPQAVKGSLVTPGTACRILEFRKPMIDKVRQDLKKLTGG